MPEAAGLSLRGDPTEKEGVDEADPVADLAVFDELIERLAENEVVFAERLYGVFFARCPEAESLFGEYSISEREEMAHETLRSLLAWREGEPWLSENLRALGASHEEYGVENTMYAPFVEATLETIAQVTMSAEGDGPDARRSSALRDALESIVETMIAGASG